MVVVQLMRQKIIRKDGCWVRVNKGSTGDKQNNEQTISINRSI